MSSRQHVSALTNALAGGQELILFDNAGVGRSSGSVPATIVEMARHAAAFARHAAAFLSAGSEWAVY